MKTLADLKRNAANYKWELMHNSWFPNSNKLKYPRIVTMTDSVKIGLGTVMEDGEVKTSYLEWPKAKELTIVDHGNNRWGVIITCELQQSEYEIEHFGKKPPHIMDYLLMPVNEG